MNATLYVRSAYSLLESTLTIADIIQCAIDGKYQAIALCDHNVLYGVHEFYYACEKVGIKPLIGMEVSVKYQEEVYSFLCYAKNNQGYLQLIQLSKRVNDLKVKELEFETFLQYQSELVVILGGSPSQYESFFLKDLWDELEEKIDAFHNYFDDFYVGLQMNDAALYRHKNQILYAKMQVAKIPCVPILPTFFKDEQARIAYHALCAMQQGKTLNDLSITYNSSANFKTAVQMHDLYHGIDDQPLLEIVNKCSVRLEELHTSLPTFCEESDDFLRKLAYRGLCKRLQTEHPPKSYVERLEYELSVITSKHFEDYFLIVYDFIRYAKQNGIYVGPGRGSAAGSLTAYCIGITGVDPIEYQLVFERFLNPERLSMPDIDIDFPDHRRDEVIQYVRQRYGHAQVANIATFGTLGAKQVIRDVCKVKGISAYDADRIAKAIPNTLKTTLSSAYAESAKFRLLLSSNRNLQDAFELAKQLEGLPRHISTHAAGIVIAKDPIEKLIPVERINEKDLLTQFQMNALEQYGLIKIDFLGLRNLTTIDKVIEQIPSFDLTKIDLNDQKTLKMIASGHTQGVFQLESVGMRALLKKMKPTSFEEVAACIALFRPGPMQFINQYLENRKDPEHITYVHPVLESILSSTYGIMIYQEQIIKVAQVMASFSAGKAELLRKAISKKQEEKFIQLKIDFVEGCITNGYDESIANEIFSWMEHFANYGFNRSHSIAYGVIAMQMAYLKAHYPAYFFSSLLSSVIGNHAKMSEYMVEAKLQQIQIKPVSLNESGKEFIVHDHVLYYPLSGIKNFRSTMVDLIIAEREHARFEGYFETIARLHMLKIGKPYLESLINAGALDFTGESRASMLGTLDEAIRYAEIVRIEDQEQSYMDFSLVSKPKMMVVSDSKKNRIEAEKNVLGVYLSDHPMTLLRHKIDEKMQSLSEQRNSDATKIIGCGQIRSLRQHKTKKGDLMAFVSVEDESMILDLVFMPKTYEKYQSLLEVNNYILFEAKNDEEQSCIVWNMKKINIDAKKE